MSQGNRPFDRVISGLSEIGLQTCLDENATGFLEGVKIIKGVLHYHPEAKISNILHEAGHLACLPRIFREKAEDDLSALENEMCQYFDRISIDHDNLESPMARALMQCSDPEATAWAWAFGIHHSIMPHVIIEDEEYGNNGAIMRIQLGNRCYVGINGLQAAGFMENIQQWPKLTKWLQDAEE